MYKLYRFIIILTLGLLIWNCDSSEDSTEPTNWTFGPFVKQDAANPCLIPDSTTTFFCPIRQDTVYWESKDVFNPAALVKDDKIYLLYRAEDKVGALAGTSRIGLAWSEDGLHFTRHPEPVFYPDNDFMKPYEWEGGCEDPRVVEDENGTYFLTYTAWNGEYARLSVASSPDLFQWKKHGLAFEKAHDGKYKDVWSKSGAILSENRAGRVIAKKVNGKYWMYWGDTDLFLAWSEDLKDWTPVENQEHALLSVIQPRDGLFDSHLVEPGPPAWQSDQGIVLIYNSRNKNAPDLPEGTYTAGQILIDSNDPAQVIARTPEYFFKPDKDYEITGQINNVTFLEGLVDFQGKYFIYYGTADSKIAVALQAR